MDKKPTLSLDYVRKNGGRETTKVAACTLSEARKLAKRVLRLGKGLYTEVDICTENGTIETIRNTPRP